MKADSPSPFARLRKNWLGNFSRKFNHSGRYVTVSFDAKTNEELEPLLPTAERFWQRRDKWFKNFHNYAVANLLDDLNARKPDDEEIAEIAKHDLSRYIAVPFSVHFYFDQSNRCCRFSVSGGKTKFMFDYVVEANGTLKDGFTSWELVCLL